jgi:hypothetical protein
MKILVAVDASGSFTDMDRWEHTKKIVNETVHALSANSEVQVVKVTTKLHFCTLEEFNTGWDFNVGDGGGLVESLLNGLEYDNVHFITDGFVDLKAFDDYVSVMILEDPHYVEDALPIVGFECLHCGKSPSLHKAADKSCPEGKGYFSSTNKFRPDSSKPIRKRTI